MLILSSFKIAEVIVDNKCKETDMIYSYGIPPDLSVKIGHRVIVPFGRGNKKLAGYILGFKESIDFDKKRLKNIIKLAEPNPLIPFDTIELVKWMRDKYLCYYIEAVHAVIPANIRIKTSYYYELVDEVNLEEILKDGSYNKSTDLLEFIEHNGGIASKEELRDNFNDNFLDNSLRKLLKSKILIRKQGVKKTETKKFERQLYINNVDFESLQIPSNAKKQIRALEIIRSFPGISTVEIQKKYKIDSSVIKRLVEKKAVKINEKEMYRFKHDEMTVEKKNELTIEQKVAIKEINSNFQENRHVLLHGVTGSGKTEIYLELIENEISKGKDGIVLVPEISLTPQMIRRFVGRFGNIVAVIHSGLSDGEKYDEWRRIKEGKAKVVIGARSAVFAPFSDLGIIIIDEEHEHTYKSEIRPKYDAREIAIKRCEIEGCKLLLGSATPTLETYYKAERRICDYSLVSIQSRVNNLPMPKIEVIDMREELNEGNKSIFSNRLYESILEKLKLKEQIILFLNRRGYSTFVSCRSCGYVLKCPNCNISLTYHFKGDYLSCHYCGYSSGNPKNCPSCDSKYIKYFGIGTQKVENEFKNIFGNINVLRMDADTTIRKDSHKKILDKYRNREADILIGTQMIGKGHDFPDVTLVGIISSDTYLNIPDFRASERTFQMITQAAGRAGRAGLPGIVFIQTYSPEHYSILYAKEHDYISFYKDEIKLRKETNYPPFSHIGNIVFSGYSKEIVEKTAKEAGAILHSYDIEDVEIWNPTEAPLSKIRNNFRWQIIMKSKKEDNIRDVLKKFNQLSFDKSVLISMDINPINML